MNSFFSHRALGAALALTVLGLPALAPRASAQAADWKQIAKPPLPAFKAAIPLRIALPNGMVIFLQEDRALPLIRGTAVIRGGSREEPAEKAGLVSMFGQTWRTSGTKARNGDALDEYLESRGARVETFGSSDSTTVQFDTLKDNFADVFAVFTDVLQNPDFKDDKVTLAKNQMNTGIARRNDDVGGIAFREARKLGYGASSPLARNTEYFTIAEVTKDDLAAWHRANVHPNNIILSVIGDFDAKTMEATLRKAFGGWAKGPAFPRQKFTAQDPKPGIYFVQRDDVNQSQIRMVHAGTMRMNPDYYAITVMNEVFGGGFSARLFSNIRSKKGLAYSVGGGVGALPDTPGLFQLSMGTKSSTTAAAIDALHEEIDNLRKAPPSEAELKGAKDAILNSFIFRVDTQRKVLIERVNNEFYGLPPDLLDQFVPGIQKVTVADVQRAIEKYVHKDKLAVLVVGKSQDFDRPLSSFGPVTNIDITIPAAKAAAPAAAPGATTGAAPASPNSPEAKALFGKVLESLGGASRVLEVKNFREKATMISKTPMGEQTVEVESWSWVNPPDRQRQALTVNGMALSRVLTAEAAFMSTPMGVQDMPASQKESALRELKLSTLALAQKASDPKLSLTVAPGVKIGEIETRLLTLAMDGAEVKLYVDPATGQVLRRVAQAGPAEQTTDYSDFRVVAGMNVAFKRTMSAGPQQSATVTVSEYEVNPTIDPKMFDRPAK